MEKIKQLAELLILCYKKNCKQFSVNHCKHKYILIAARVHFARVTDVLVRKMKEWGHLGSSVC